jgi:hypothetical protein
MKPYEPTTLYWSVQKCYAEDLDDELGLGYCNIVFTIHCETVCTMHPAEPSIGVRETVYENTPFEIKEIEIEKILTEDDEDVELNQKNIEKAKKVSLKDKDYLDYKINEGFYDPNNHIFESKFSPEQFLDGK